MHVLKTDPRGSTIHHTRIIEVIALSRVWLGIAEVSRTRQLSKLAPEQVLQVLQAGESVSWQGWTLKTLPPRRIGLPTQTSEWAAGILALSAYGLLSELRVDAECVHRICRRIQDMEHRQALARKEEAQEGCQASELEDG